MRGGWTSSYWKRQVLMFYPLGKDSEKSYGGWHPSPPPSPALYVRGLIFDHSYLYPSKVPVSVPFGFPAVSVWRGVYSVRHFSTSCCYLLIILVCLLFLPCLGEVVRIFFSSHNSWNRTPFCLATLPRLPLPPFSFVIFTADVNCSNIGKILQIWSTFLKK